MRILGKNFSYYIFTFFIIPKIFVSCRYFKEAEGSSFSRSLPTICFVDKKIVAAFFSKISTYEINVKDLKITQSDCELFY